ncbi:MAG: NUDIX domain-containing protein [Microgenomates group bacterium]
MIVQQVVIAVIRKNNKYLLTKRTEINPEDSQFAPYVWNFPGGGVKKNESYQQALTREIKEELNVSLDKIVRIPKIFSDTRGQWQGIFNVFLCSLKDEKQEIILNEEASEYNWFTTNEIKNLKTLPFTFEIAQEADKINL